MLRYLLALLALATLATCQYQVDSSVLPDIQKFLVISADVTEKYAKVKVDYTLEGITSQGGYLFPKPPRATAYILDNKGNRRDFKTDGTADSTFHGQVGETYTLYVELDGMHYVSDPETMRPCPPLDTALILYSRDLSRAPDDAYYDGFDIYVELGDQSGTEDYYQWDWIHYERLFGCNKRKEGGQEVWLPCNPYDCWGISYNDRVVVQSDKLRDGQRIAHKIVRVPYAKPPLKYYLRLEQRAITPNVFAYLRALETQTQSVGTRFDVPAQTLFSPNIQNIDNPTEKILGVFSVFSAKSKVIFVDREQPIPGAIIKDQSDNTPFTTDPFANAPCKEGIYRTQKRPEGWRD